MSTECQALEVVESNSAFLPKDDARLSARLFSGAHDKRRAESSEPVDSPFHCAPRLLTAELVSELAKSM